MRRRKRGKLIVIDGIDQSGKKTQTRLLARKLRASGRPCAIWSFPDYTTPVGRELRSYLSGRKKLDFHTVHLLYAANKWERALIIRNQLKEGKFVIINRYTPSNLAYGVAHGLRLEWLQRLEDELPKPDIVLVLDVPAKISFRRKRNHRDVHEEDSQYLTKVRSIYLRLARRFHWKILEASDDQETVGVEVWKVVSGRQLRRT